MLPVFKTGERQAQPVSGVFDSHTLPPSLSMRRMPVCRLKNCFCENGFCSVRCAGNTPRAFWALRMEIYNNRGFT